MNRAIGKYKCPCCGFYTFDEKLNGNYDICPVCFWEDDPIQLEDNEYEGGANRVSLIQARHNFLLFGACEEEMKKHVRKPKEDELRGIDQQCAFFSNYRTTNLMERILWNMICLGIMYSK